MDPLSFVLISMFAIGVYMLVSKLFTHGTDKSAPARGIADGVGDFINQSMFGYSATFKAIGNSLKSIADVTAALSGAGVESCNMIFAIDYTQSNEDRGAETFGGRCLHTIEEGTLNPYQQVLLIMGRTLKKLDEDNLIPMYGFGDLKTKGTKCFLMGGEPSHSIQAAYSVYNDTTPHIKFSGPTNFAPVIKEAIKITQAAHDFHVLVIICDGQVTSEPETIKAIVEASKYPLAIICVGVGDGPWDQMHMFDDKLPERAFDNFQFVEFHKIMASTMHLGTGAQEAAFAVAACQEIPEQYMAVKKLGYL